jgi:hypothetical protein
MNYTFSKGFGQFKTNYFKQSFKCKNMFSAFNSNLNKGKSFINFSNQLFFQRVVFLTNNLSMVNGNTGVSEVMVSGESRVCTDLQLVKQELLTKISGSIIDRLFSLCYLTKYGIKSLIY